MSDIQSSEIQIKNEIKVNDRGYGVATIRGVARIVGIDKSALLRHFQGGDFSESKLFEKLTRQGFTPGDFSEKGVPDIAVALIVEHYAFDAGARCTETAKASYRSFAGVGIRVWMQQVAGWESPVVGHQKIDYSELGEYAEAVRLVRAARLVELEPIELLKLQQTLKTGVTQKKPASAEVVTTPDRKVEILKQFLIDSRIHPGTRNEFVEVKAVWDLLQDWYESNDVPQSDRACSKAQDVFAALQSLYPKLVRYKHSATRRALIFGLKQHQDDAVDVIVDRLDEWIADKDLIQSRQAAEFLGMNPTRSNLMLIAKALHLIGFSKDIQRVDGVPARIWVRNDGLKQFRTRLVRQSD